MEDQLPVSVFLALWRILNALNSLYCKSWMLNDFSRAKKVAIALTFRFATFGSQLIPFAMCILSLHSQASSSNF